MTPILRDKHDASIVLGVLDDCISCTVSEEINGAFVCEFVYPATGPLFETLTGLDCMIEAAHAHRGDGSSTSDFFDVYKYSAPINGLVTFYAQHVSYRLTNIIVNGGFTATDPYDALDKIFARVLNDNPFRYTSGTWSGDAGTLTVDGYADARGLMLGREGVASCVNTWNCEFLFAGFNVAVFEQRGTNEGVQIRYGKNITDVTREKDNGGIISLIFPYWHDSEGTTVVKGTNAVSPKLEAGLSRWTTGKIVFDPSPRVIHIGMTANGENFFFRPAILNAAAVDFSDQFENAPTVEELRQAALTYMRKNSTWRSNDNITVDFIDLFGTPEYEDIKLLALCNLGDFVSVYYPQLGIVSEGVEIVAVTFDSLAERYTQMQLGTIKTTLAQTIIDYIGGIYK